MKLLLGADPEGFIFNKETNKFVSAHGLIPGDKAKPFPVPCGAIQVDGMAAEFNINPASTEDEWVTNLETVMSYLQEYLPKGHEMKYVPVAMFDQQEWDNTPDAAKVLGCDPDMNAYTGANNKTPVSVDRMRVAGGHIHFGWCEGMDVNDKGHKTACLILAKELDRWLSIYSGMFDFGPMANQRKSMYGTLGAIRIKPYGMEYRTPSNAWLQSPELMRWVYRTCHMVFNNLMEGKASGQVTDPYPTDSTIYNAYCPFSLSVADYDFYVHHGYMPKLPDGVFLDFVKAKRKVQESGAGIPQRRQVVAQYKQAYL